jgi:hypothetical protein
MEFQDILQNQEGSKGMTGGATVGKITFTCVWGTFTCVCGTFLLHCSHWTRKIQIYMKGSYNCVQSNLWKWVGCWSLLAANITYMNAIRPLAVENLLDTSPLSCIPVNYWMVFWSVILHCYIPMSRHQREQYVTTCEKLWDSPLKLCNVPQKCRLNLPGTVIRWQFMGLRGLLQHKMSQCKIATHGFM